MRRAVLWSAKKGTYSTAHKIFEDEGKSLCGIRSRPPKRTWMMTLFDKGVIRDCKRCYRRG